MEPFPVKAHNSSKDKGFAIAMPKKDDLFIVAELRGLPIQGTPTFGLLICETESDAHAVIQAIQMFPRIMDDCLIFFSAHEIVKNYKNAEHMKGLYTVATLALEKMKKTSRL